MRETAGQNHRVGAAELGVLVPDQLGLFAEHLRRGVEGVVVRIGAGKDDDREFHDRHLDAVALDHRIGEQLVGHLGHARLGAAPDRRSSSSTSKNLP